MDVGFCQELAEKINTHLKDECKTIEQFLAYFLKTKKTLGNIHQDPKQKKKVVSLQKFQENETYNSYCQL